MLAEGSEVYKQRLREFPQPLPYLITRPPLQRTLRFSMSTPSSFKFCEGKVLKATLAYRYHKFPWLVEVQELLQKLTQNF